jgi:hydrogenase maturation protein HypF
MNPPAPTRQRRRLRVEGTVQGVGFRPHAYRLAGELGLAGSVRNEGGGVHAEIEGPAEQLERFAELLVGRAPAAARIDRLEVAPLPPRGEERFRIEPSCGDAGRLPIPPDLAPCTECLRELADPADRRHRYPFVNCTACGPRFSIVRSLPYDRAGTTMAGFQLCERCRGEYEDPADRRFHAEPNACPACGPRLRLTDGTGRAVPIEDGSDEVAAAAAALREGAIVALKGVGGFHLACRADEEGPVARLRAGKRRPEQPLAVMVGTLEGAGELAALDPPAERLLTGPARPIVLVPRRAGAALAPSVAPALDELGLMLPASPLHHLLLADAALPLVMTSGNRHGESIAIDDEAALGQLGAVADLFLLHDRPIAARVDDSLVRPHPRPADRETATLRRARGLVPGELALPAAAARPILACGAELKSTFCLARGSGAWVGQHVGDLGSLAARRAFDEALAGLSGLLGFAPELIAHDLHPDYASTRFALAQEGAERLAVQHHHSHLAACLAEHGERGPAVGLILDGAGLGSDGTVWGGELLVGDLRGFERAGHLLEVPLPGGDAAAREPWRMAAAWLAAAGGEDEPALPAALRGAVPEERWGAVCRLAASGAAPRTSSAGRLFDAVAAICGVRHTASYEGQAAIELEASCVDAASGGYAIEVHEQAAGPVVLDPRGAIAAIAADAGRGEPVGTIASRFHAGLAAACAAAAAGIAADRGLDRVALGGGALANRRLLRGVLAGLAERGLEVLVPQALPAGDGGISFGQAAIAAAHGDGD